MKEYTKPEVLVTEISSTDDILALSGGVVTEKFTGKQGYTEVKF